MGRKRKTGPNDGHIVQNERERSFLGNDIVASTPISHDVRSYEIYWPSSTSSSISTISFEDTDQPGISSAAPMPKNRTVRSEEPRSPLLPRPDEMPADFLEQLAEIHRSFKRPQGA